jgi:hypothetical protein
LISSNTIAKKELPTVFFSDYPIKSDNIKLFIPSNKAGAEKGAEGITTVVSNVAQPTVAVLMAIGMPSAINLQ